MSTLLAQTTALRKLEWVAPSQRMDEKLLTTIVTNNARLKQLIVRQCDPLSDDFFRNVLTSCPKLNTMRLGDYSNAVERRVAIDTLVQLAERIEDVELDCCIVAPITGKEVEKLATVVRAKGHLFRLAFDADASVSFRTWFALRDYMKLHREFGHAYSVDFS
jgi:hypothetical protein